MSDAFGREEDARALRLGLEAALAGNGRAVVLLGEASVGKSRLARDLVSKTRNRWTVLTGRAPPWNDKGSMGMRAPADALQPVFRTHRPRDADDIRPFVAPLGRLMPDWRADGAGCASDPMIMAGVLRLLRLLADPTASLLVLEDLHWADAETLAVVNYLADNIGTEPVLRIFTCQTGEHSAGGDAIQTLIDRRTVEPIPLSRGDRVPELM